MDNRRKGVILTVIAACGISMFLHAQDSAPTTGAAFGDPAHQVFFNYMKFLTKKGEVSETAETWVRLAPAERVKKVEEGEAFLKELHARLLKKTAMTDEETALFAAVWGGSDSRFGLSGRDKVPPAQVQQRVEAEAKVRTLSGKVDANQNNWGRMFDGNRQSAVGGMDATPGVPEAKRSYTLTAAVKKTHLSQADVPPITNAPVGNAGKAAPLAIGVVFLASLYWGVKRFAGGRRDGAAPAFPGTEKITLDELGRPTLPDGMTHPSRGAYRIATADVGCTDSDCACPPPVSTCPVNVQCSCPTLPVPPAPLPQCKCPTT